MMYAVWIKQVDAIVEKRTGLGLDQLPDWLSRDAWAAGMTPKQGAEACLEQTRWEDCVLIDEL